MEEVISLQNEPQNTGYGLKFLSGLYDITVLVLGN
jgi:hypothetical protein